MKNILSKASAYLAQKLTPELTIQTKAGPVRFYCPGEITLWRAQTLFTKEPETIEWVDGFAPGSVFWDIGANVGVYSLYAALRKDIEILAFEPSVYNCHILNRNIELNNMDDRIMSLAIAFSDKTSIDRFYMSSTEPGSALHNFAEAIDHEGKPFVPKFKQGAMGVSIDDFITRFNPPFPNYIKIDVDGIESKIVNGAKITIADKRLKSVLIELDTDNAEECGSVTDIFRNSGLRLFSKRHAAMFDTGKYASIYNHIFVRD